MSVLQFLGICRHLPRFCRSKAASASSSVTLLSHSSTVQKNAAADDAVVQQLRQRTATAGRFVAVLLILATALMAVARYL